ncbi:MAG: PH domain-containing protein [Nitrosopumilus sp.]|nr:PH domain-containing protein [Nitrosopumilus sp.]
MLNPDEKVLLVARQSRVKPGGSYFSPNVIFATDRRIILRDPTMLGLKQEIIDIPYNVITNAKLEKGILSSSVIFNAPGLFNPNISNRIPGIKRLNTDEHGENGVIDAIPKKKGDDLIEIIRNGITQIRVNPGLSTGIGNNFMAGKTTSPTEELAKLADLKESGVLSEEEFNKMKEKILKKDY